jgi:sugar (pentulose or hexulose) kinase
VAGGVTVSLGLDLGTTRIKAVAVRDEHLVVSYARPTPWRDGELLREDLLRCAFEVVRTVISRTAEVPVALGITGMAETGFLEDETGAPIGTAVPWYDARGDASALERLGPTFTRATGLPVSGLCSAAMYAWMRHHRPGSERGTRWTGVPETVAAALTGLTRTDPSLACRTGFYRLDGEPAGDVLEALGAPGDLLPPVHALGAPGSLLPMEEAPRRSLGLASTIPVVIAGHDHIVAAAVVTTGAELLDSTGTAEALVRSVAPSSVDILAAASSGLAVGHHVLPGLHYAIGTVFEAGPLQASLRGRLELSRRIRALATALRTFAGPFDSATLVGGYASPAVAHRRQRDLGVPVTRTSSREMAGIGAALLAERGVHRRAGGHEEPRRST